MATLKVQTGSTKKKKPDENGINKNNKHRILYKAVKQPILEIILGHEHIMLIINNS